MKLSNNFLEGKLNKDIDERLLPKGQYRHVENIRMANSDGSDVGAIENVLGNKALTDLGLTDSYCIGSFVDGSNNKIYWFVTSNEKNLIMEYAMDGATETVTTVLSSDVSGDNVLNFRRANLITGVNKVING